MLKKILPLLATAMYLWSCTPNKNAGFILSAVPLVQGVDPESPIIQYLNAGDKVEYIGSEQRPTEGRIRVRFGTTEGYVMTELVVFGDVKPVVAKTAIVAWPTLTSTEPIPMAYDGQFLIADSVAGDKTHVYGGSPLTHGWVDTKDISSNAEDVEIAVAMDRAALKASDDVFALTFFEAAVAKYPNHWLLQTFKVNLSEASDEDLVAIRGNHAFAYDKANNTVTLSKLHARAFVSRQISNILVRSRGSNPNFYTNDEGDSETTDPIDRYFHKYLAVLPSFVKVGAISETIDWGIMHKEEPVNAFFVYRLDRSAENIRALYSQFRPTINSMITAGVIRDIRTEGKTLMRIYDHITKVNNYKQVLSDISKEVAASDKKLANKKGRIAGGYAHLDQRPLYQPIILQSVFDETQGEHRALWYHSFWVRRFAEGNAEVIYDILKDLVTLVPTDQPVFADAEDVYGDEVFEEGFGDSPDDYPTGDEESVITSTCTYYGFTIGDCAHYDFGNCGDYGDADVSRLTKADRALWSDLVTTVDGEEVGNPELVGKKFIISETTTYKDICNEGKGGKGDAPKILLFEKTND